MRSRSFVLVAFLLTSLPSPASAAPITILNAGFEAPGTGFLAAPLDSWIVTGDVSVWNINSSPAGFWSVPAPEGNQVGTFSGVGTGAATAEQTVGVLAPNSVYTLSGYVGHPLGWGASQTPDTQFLAELWAGSNLLASTTGTGPEGSFQQFQLQFDSTGSAFVGQALRVVIGSTQPQTSFDALALDASAAQPTAVPEPASLVLFGIGLGALGVRHQRTRRIRF